MTIKRKLACLNTSLALAIVVAAPALADDTELLLTTPASNAKPNINFILDTSGSMNTLEHTIAFYDSAVNYSGTCTLDSLYWSDSGTPPVCDDRREIHNTSFVCFSAAGQLNAVGSYTGVVAQYRDKGPKWNDLNENLPTNTVECAADSGIHGNGTAGEVYARIGRNNVEFTSNPAQEIDWGSSPTNQSYTLYSGNYLNWRANPPEASIKRIDIVRSILKKVLGAYDSVNLSLMAFNNNEGGFVSHAMQDLKDSRAELYTTLDGITAVGNTPLSETLYESALYWQGLNVHYGAGITDPDAMPSPPPTPEIYKSPAAVISGTCSRNYNVILSDSLPKNDAGGLEFAPTLPGWSDALGGRMSCDDYVAEGDCIDDIAEYLFNHDINPNLPGLQNVRTFGAGFLAPQQTLDLMNEAAELSDGEFFVADNPEALAVSLLSIFDEITEQSLTFVAPAIAVNAFNRTQNLNDVYMSVFQSSLGTHWPGNLKKYRIVDGEITDMLGAPAVDPTTGFLADSAKSFWTVGNADGSDITMGGAANILPDPATRRVFTNNGVGLRQDLTAGTNALSDSNLASFIVDDFGLTGSVGEPTVADIINWARGEDVKDVDNDTDTTTRFVMGDPLHAQPAAVDYGTGGNADVVVFSATNDGYLHAIDADTGVELWSFVPKELLKNFASLYSDLSGRSKQYGIDGNITPVVFDEDGNGRIDGDNDFIYIVFGMRRGGANYYALDVTSKNSPELLWNVTHDQFEQTWSTPVIARVNTTEPGLNSSKAVVIVGAGYNSAHDAQSTPTEADIEGAGIFMLDLETGAEIWRAGPDDPADLTLSTAGREMTRAFPSRIKVIDLNGDGFADRMYAADVGGQVWRFDISSGQNASNLVTGGIIARLGFEGIAPTAGEGPARIYNSPDIALFTDTQQNRRFISVSVGSGYRAHPLNTTANDRFYSVRDPNVFNQLLQDDFDSYEIATLDNMQEVSGKLGTVITSADKGWYFTMPANQMVLSDSITFDDSVFFVGFSPEATSTDICDPTLGKNFLYRVNIVNGDPVVANLDTLLPENSDAARTTDLAQGGIAPSLAILFPSPDDDCTGVDCYPPPLGCVGVECFDPGFVNNPVRTLWTQDGIE